MDKGTTLILAEVNQLNDIFFSYFERNNYITCVIFKRINKLFRLIRRIWLINNFPFSYIWYGKWFNELNKYQTVIIYTSKLTRYIPLYINKKYPNLRIINWYWNTVDNKTLPLETNISKIEYWSFDSNDCIKYNMKRNVQFYCKEESFNVGYIKNDIYFIGRDKGRRDKITEFENICKKYNIKYDFNIIYGNEIIPYNEVRKSIIKSRAILEINKKNQSGLTLRALESLFYEKKLITDNILIANYDFYNSDNIFVLGKDNINNLPTFISSSYNHSVDVYKNEYSLEKWFNNFNE